MQAPPVTVQCLRCHQDLPAPRPAYCPHCAAPQMRCVEDEAPVQEAPGAIVLPGTGPDWAAAVTACLTAAGATGLLSSLLVFPVNEFFLIWSIAGAALAVVLYERRTRLTTMSSGFGARLGMVTGLLAGAAMMLFSAVFLVLQRFAFGNGWKIDNFLTDHIGQIILTTAPEVQTQLRTLSSVPDWRAGLMFLYAAVMIALMVLFGVFGGAMSGKYYSLKRRLQQAR